MRTLRPAELHYNFRQVLSTQGQAVRPGWEEDAKLRVFMQHLFIPMSEDTHRGFLLVCYGHEPRLRDRHRHSLFFADTYQGGELPSPKEWDATKDNSSTGIGYINTKFLVRRNDNTIKSSSPTHLPSYA